MAEKPLRARKQGQNERVGGGGHAGSLTFTGARDKISRRDTAALLLHTRRGVNTPDVGQIVSGKIGQK